ncbi:MAG TPA: hypothetical protein VMM92_04840 [Thermoanaerobaculia bacterium]|nr:hypothetical protein [Thermoanaerobaculia bacterium]
MQIAFVTLFLGLISGRVPLELQVTGVPGPAAIELRLDGADAGRLTRPPFRGEIDLGKDLLPHHLEAWALDAQGLRAAYAELWVNLPHPPAVLDLTTEPGEGGRIGAVRVSYHSSTHEPAHDLTARLDGRPLPISGNRALLPAYPPELPHLLSIEARSASGLAAHRDLAFGGGLEGEVATELTAALLRSPSRLPTVDKLAGWFTAEGKALTPVAVEEGPAELLVVRDREVPEELLDLGRRTLHDITNQRLRGVYGFELPLPKDLQLRFVETGAHWYLGAEGRTALFGVSTEVTGGKDGGLYWRLANTLLAHEEGPPQLADAVAVAGVQALADQRRRAVLLVLSGLSADRSRHDPATVRRYLAALHVPLYVWSLDRPPYPDAIAAWGRVEDASSFTQLRRAYSRLLDDLGSQCLVWLDGRHLPQALRLSPVAAKAAKDVELLGEPKP